MKPMIPVGMEYFSDIRDGYYFVDKTNFISEFFSDKQKVTLITRPRRFGKTLTTYDFARCIDAARVLIVTNRPSIANSWYQDFAQAARQIHFSLEYTPDPAAAAAYQKHLAVYKALYPNMKGAYEALADYQSSLNEQNQPAQ